MANITDFFIDSLYNISKRELEHKYVEIAQRCILDYLGVTLAGASMLSSEMNSYLGNFLNEGGSCTVIGMNSKTTLYNAVFVNGFNAHVAELDDGHRYAAVHPGAPIISALLPLLEGNRVSENDLIRGLIVGYEATIVLGRSIQPYHKKQGFHTTGTCGTVGAAMAVSAAMRFSKQMMKNALSAAVTSASGVLEVIDDSSQIKPYNSSKAALNGLLSAFIGNAGLNGPEDVLGETRVLAVMGIERPGIYEQTDMSSLAIEEFILSHMLHVVIAIRP